MALDAFPHEQPLDPGQSLQLHAELCKLNRLRLQPVRCAGQWSALLDEECRLRRLEHRYVEELRAEVRERAALAPRDPDLFVGWFEALEESGPGQGDVLFPWLAQHASLSQMRWFLSQEIAGEAGFDDLVALTQVKLPVRPKLELARNYWDEMGQGTASGMHGPMLDQLARALELRNGVHEVVWESLALANLLVALAANRHYTYQSIGALGAIELTAPGRAACVNAGLKRLGVLGDARRYYALHSTLDRKHSAAWDREVLHPLVASQPDTARLIAEGALLRLLAGQRCFVRYRETLMSQAVDQRASGK